MTRALIAEDEALLAEHLATELLALWPGLTLLPIATHGQAALDSSLADRPDIVFLDIRMPGMSGLEAATALMEDWPDDAGPLPLIVFVTAYDEYALKAFDACAVDYVLKPVTPARLGQTVTRLKAALAMRQAPSSASAPPDINSAAAATLAALQQLMRQANPGPRLRHLQAAVGEAIELVPVESIVYLEAADKYVRAVTAAKEYWVRVSLKELLPQLDPDRFWQVHRSTVIHIDAVVRAHRQENGQVLLELRERAERVTVSRIHAARFKAL